MASGTPNPAARLALLGAIDAVLPAAPRAAENEVIALFDQLHAGLFRYVVSLGIGAADAEDVIQEVFLSLFRHVRLRRSRENLRGWVFRVAHNLALKHRQRARRAEARDGAAEGALSVCADPAANVEERLVESQHAMELIRAVAALSEKDQNCLRLRAEGLSYREIARALGMSLGAVGKSLARSIERLSRVNGRWRHGV